MHGDAVVTFMRALCAASQEELHPTVPGQRWLDGGGGGGLGQAIASQAQLLSRQMPSPPTHLRFLIPD